MALAVLHLFYVYSNRGYHYIKYSIDIETLFIFTKTVIKKLYFICKIE